MYVFMYILIYTHTRFFVGHFSLLSMSKVVETTINLDQKVNIIIPYLSCSFLESFNQLYILSKTSLSKDPTSALLSTKSTKKDTFRTMLTTHYLKQYTALSLQMVCCTDTPKEKKAFHCTDSQSLAQ